MTYSNPYIKQPLYIDIYPYMGNPYISYKDKRADG